MTPRIKDNDRDDITAEIEGEAPMKYQDIPAKLSAIQSALVDKIECQPFIDPMMKVHQSGKWEIPLYPAFNGGDYDLGKITADSPAECIEAAFQFIANLPDPDTAAKQAWQGKLGKVIDEGHALNLPDDVMTPLRQGSQAMTENLLAAPKADQSEVA